MNDEELTEFALKVIGAVDYDIKKECELELEETDESSIVDKVKEALLEFIDLI